MNPAAEVSAVKIPNGTYTITNAKGEHRTFAVKTIDADYKVPALAGKRIACLLRGPDNENDYTGFAFVEGDVVKVWHKKATVTYSWYAVLLMRAAAEIREMVEQETPSAEITLKGRRYTVQVSKRCIVCNRKLTDPLSIRLQIGPTCRGDA